MPSPPSALDVATKLLSGRDKTRAQIVSALERKGFAAEEIGSTCDRLTSLGYLDDARVAERRAKDDLEDGWTPEAIEHRLAQAGIDSSTARAALGRITSEVGWSSRDAARSLLERRKLKGPKAARFLASRGFDEDTISSLVDLGSAPP